MYNPYVPCMQPLADCIGLCYHGTGTIENLETGGTCASIDSGVRAVLRLCESIILFYRPLKKYDMNIAEILHR